MFMSCHGCITEPSPFRRWHGWCSPSNLAGSLSLHGRKLLNSESLLGLWPPPPHNDCIFRYSCQSITTFLDPEEENFAGRAKGSSLVSMA